MEQTLKNILKDHPIVDTHAHYDDEKFSVFSDDDFKNLKNNGVDFIINNAVDLGESAKEINRLSEQYDFFYSAFGVHPETVKADFRLDGDRLVSLLKLKKTVAVGEIGLDYYWSAEYKNLQKDVFAEQLSIANEHNFPVIVHDREAHGDTLDILRLYRPTGTVHCFSGSREMARDILNIGMYIGIGGVLTFKNARKIREVAEYVPLDRILLETDAPYMAPEPMRGKTNLSHYIVFVAEKLAEIKGISIETVLDTAYNNAKTLYKF